MPLRNKQSQLHVLMAIPVVLIILGAVAVSAAAVVENLRFINATNQILGLVSLTRSVAAAQKNFAQNPGEDIWNDLIAMNQISAAANRLNPWRGEVRATTLTNGIIRLETDLPPRDCRRISSYFIEHQPAELGLVLIEGQPAAAASWAQIYTGSAVLRDRRPEIACGARDYARLALVFKIR